MCVSDTQYLTVHQFLILTITMLLEMLLCCSLALSRGQISIHYFPQNTMIQGSQCTDTEKIDTRDNGHWSTEKSKFKKVSQFPKVLLGLLYLSM